MWVNNFTKPNNFTATNAPWSQTPGKLPLAMRFARTLRLIWCCRRRFTPGNPEREKLSDVVEVPLFWKSLLYQSISPCRAVYFHSSSRERLEIGDITYHLHFAVTIFGNHCIIQNRQNESRHNPMLETMTQCGRSSLQLLNAAAGPRRFSAWMLGVPDRRKDSPGTLLGVKWWDGFSLVMAVSWCI